MTRRQPALIWLLLCGAWASSALAQAARAAPHAAPPAEAVSVRQGTLTLPTYEEGLPDVNPRFDLFARRPFLIYPYTTLGNLSDRRSPRTWRTLVLENAYLKLTVLPDLGGRIYSCVDKANGAEMLYANPSIKYADVAYRGAWVALGVEFNFPVSHNWVTVSPVDFAAVRHRDGSASVWVGNVDRVYGMEWRVELTLRPGRSLLEQTVTLYNRSDLRHRFYWWNTASVAVTGDSHIVYPMQLSAAHWFADVDSWPIDASGTDLSYPRNHVRGYVSRFAYGTREPFMGVYQPASDSGMVHVAPHHDLPGKKIWSWGWDDEGRDWRRALSDDDSAYVEVQAGLFRNQETYAFLEPQRLLRFRETYQPVRGIGGFSRATEDGVLHLRRGKAGELRVGVNVTRTVRGGRLRVKEAARTLLERAFSLTPGGAFDRGFASLTGPGPYTVEIADSTGTVLLSHTEGRYDWLPRSELKTGPQPTTAFPEPGQRSEGDWVELGRFHELNGRLLEARETYEAALRAFPGSLALGLASGRLDVQLKRFEEAVARLSGVVERTSNDAEALYYLGQARLAVGDVQRAEFAWDQAATLPAFRGPALFALGRLAAREGDAARALRLVRQALAAAPDMIRAGATEVALLRRLGRPREASDRLAHWQALDPPDNFLRHEAVLLGGAAGDLWTHLAADPERVIGLAVDYMAIGAWDDAHALLARRFPGAGVVAEPGTALPQDYPLVAYYRGYCAERLGRSGRRDAALAERQSTRYVFPSRAESLPVLQAALAANPDDATAHFLLGSLFLSGGRSEQALVEWQRARALEPGLPVLHRDIGFTLLYARGAADEALTVFVEGMRHDPRNVELYEGADQALSLLGRGPEQRIALLGRYPDRELPPSLLYKLALALADAGRFGEAEALFPGRFFPREEFGTNVRQVYLELELREALSLARAGRRQESAALATRLGLPVAGLGFTKDGLGAFLDSPRLRYYRGELLSLLGDEAAARELWKQAAAGSDFRQVAFAWRAAQAMGDADEAAWRPRLQAALAEADSYLFRGGHYPGVATLARGMLLRALGRGAEGDAALHQVFLLPDKGLSHQMARLALQER